MTLLTCEFDDGAVREWHATSKGLKRQVNHDYTPTLFVDGSTEALEALTNPLQSDPKVATVKFENWFTGLDDRERSRVLRIDCERVTEVRTVAREIRALHEPEYTYPGRFRLYNIDLAPQFRYCIETNTPPIPQRDLRVLDLSIPEPALRDEDLSALTGDGDPLGDTPREVLETLQTRLDERDPDILCCSTARIIPLCHDHAAEIGFDDFRLGRAQDYEQLADANTYESYGQVGHSPARYRVPGRATVDRSNSFLLDESGIPGLLDLVERSWRPLQETAWGSIGTILTAIQVRHALNQDVLIPWNKWEPEAFKDARTLHAADRGGTTLAPEVGRHRDVYEIDFASLYPTIIREYNVSPDTVRCDCHPDREDVPELGYNVCPDRGFLPDVLGPLLDDREEIKRDLETASGDERARLEAQSSAIKWVLVSCFGYQGYRNSKFGRIECHEAINAIARDHLLTAKECAEDRGWRVVHGIVDSLWLEPVDPDHAPVEAVIDAIADAVGIPLDREARYEWIAFCPKRDSREGALTRYFGKQAGGDYKVRGIEARQRSTPTFVEAVQRDLLDVVDETRDPEAVCARLRTAIGRLEARRVDPDDLVIRTRVSKRLAEYRQSTRTVAALQRCRLHDLERHPGQDVRYVVVDDNADGRERVRLAFEDVPDYDARFYTELLVRATESVTAPLGWDRIDIRRHLRGAANYELGAFG